MLLPLLMNNLLASASAEPQNGGGFYNGPGTAYKKATRQEISRLKRLMGFESVAETQAFIQANPEPARMALAVFEISADPDALIAAVLEDPRVEAERERLKQAADAEALAVMRQRARNNALSVLLILAAVEW